MKIEMWSDYACPFCYIGKRRLEEALEKFEHRDQVEWVLKSYQLAPDNARDIGKSIYEVIAEKNNMSVEQAKENMNNPVEQAKQFGLELNFDRVIPTNTLDAHRLAHFAAEKGKEQAMSERLMKAYFTDGLHIGDHEVLTELAVEVGLDRDEVTALLQSSKYADLVKQQREEGLATGLKMIPHILIDGKYVYFGGQTSDKVLEALNQAWNDRSGEASQPEQEVTVIEGCTADGCAI